MSISPKNRVFVWAKCGAKCSYKDCKKHLIESTMEGSESLIGEVAHIVSSSGGPRSEYDLQSEGINHDEPANLMLMCKDHHKLIDDHPEEYPVMKLRKWKQFHESEILKAKTPEELKHDKDRITVGLYITQFEEKVFIDNWLNWGQALLSAHQPKLNKKVQESLSELSEWIIARIWPKTGDFDDLQLAFVNFKNVLCDFLIIFNKEAEDFGSSLMTKKFYRISEWNPELYNDLSIQYDFHVWLVEDLFYELTRALNLICDEVRNSLDSSYRLDKGAVLVRTGFDMSLHEYTYRVEYKQGQRYEGLEVFKTERKTRDRFCSVGKDHEDPEFLEMWKKCH